MKARQEDALPLSFVTLCCCLYKYLNSAHKNDYETDRNKKRKKEKEGRNWRWKKTLRERGQKINVAETKCQVESPLTLIRRDKGSFGQQDLRIQYSPSIPLLLAESALSMFFLQAQRSPDISLFCKIAFLAAIGCSNGMGKKNYSMS
ncbi:hypothetical protein CEXT_87661 [Caerostris extrusa]|uniref:Uncharacterized protein n=1 Tax=Caerostris extrusa TaxID=172846 RepID=A0AAV4Y4T9_CAEEX|nr:hypothetical protein CEXT_87661 [Caerostris extrusa]